MYTRPEAARRFGYHFDEEVCKPLYDTDAQFKKKIKKTDSIMCTANYTEGTCRVQRHDPAYRTLKAKKHDELPLKGCTFKPAKSGWFGRIAPARCDPLFKDDQDFNLKLGKTDKERCRARMKSHKCEVRGLRFEQDKKDTAWHEPYPAPYPKEKPREDFSEEEIERKLRRNEELKEEWTPEYMKLLRKQRNVDAKKEKVDAQIIASSQKLSSLYQTSRRLKGLKEKLRFKEGGMEKQMEKLGVKMPRMQTRGSSARQDARSGVVVFDDGLTLLLGNGAPLNRLELDALQGVREVSSTGCALEVLIAMHGEINVTRNLITAPPDMCVQILRYAPAGCSYITDASENGARARAEFFLNLHTQGKASVGDTVYTSLAESAKKYAGNFGAHATRITDFMDRESVRGEFCRLVTCSPEQLFFDKAYGTDDEWSSITIQNFWETKDVDLFPIMQKCGYTESLHDLSRASLFRFFGDLGVRSVTFYDSSCSVTNEMDEVREADYLRVHQHVMGGRGSKTNNIPVTYQKHR